MSLLKNRKVGALLRCFARTPEQVDGAVAQTISSVHTMLKVKVGDDPFVRRVEILVPLDQSYGDCDCGQTSGKLRDAVLTSGLEHVYVNEVSHGDIFVGVLNYGIAKLLRAGCDYGVILSKEAEAYFTAEAAQELVTAIEGGAKVTGIALNELTESVMQGRIANTFAMWDLMALMQVGGFDWRSAKPKKDSVIVTRAQTWDAKKGLSAYDLAGVEEIVPMIRMVRTFGPCIAPVLPRSGGVWEAPNPTTDPIGYERHVNKLGTKFVRQNHFADQEHADLSFLMGGVMEAYQNPNYIK